MPIVDNTEQLREILRSARTIAVVGLSDKPWRDSFTVASFMQSRGYRIIPVNPLISSALGTKALPSLDLIKEPVDIVNVFRRPEFVPDIAASAISIGARTLWLQAGIIHQEAAERASKAGLNVVMDRCIRVAYTLLLSSRP
jgi:predicted CoA-binding protein